MTVYKVTGPPGTGKTRWLLDRVDEYLKQGLSPQRIAFISFSRNAANEARQRAMKQFDYPAHQYRYFRTEHSICFRLLAETVGLSRQNIFTGRHKKEFAQAYHYDLTIDEQEMNSRFAEAMLTTLSDYYEFFVNWMKNMMLPFDAAYKNFCSNNLLPSGWSRQGLLKYIEHRNRFKMDKSLWDFNDLIQACLERNLYPDVDVLIADEMQDSSKILFSYIENWSKRVKDTYIAGDYLQCLPLGTQIATPKGAKKIENFKEGDEVLVSHGAGYIGTSRVLKVHKNAQTNLFITLTTRSGYKLRLTANHRLFAYIPFAQDAYKRFKSPYFYVYLMRKDNMWRIGITNQPGSRLRTEGSQPIMYLLRDFSTESEARYYEEYLSLKYGIPTQTFISHGENHFLCGDVLAKLCQELNVEWRVKRLIEDLVIDLNYPIYIAQSSSRVHRLIINVILSGTNWARGGRCRPRRGINMLNLETSDEQVLAKLRQYGYHLCKAKKGYRLRIESEDFAYIQAEALKLQTLTQGQIRIVHTAIINNKARYGLLVSAGNILRGFFVPVLKNSRVIYDEVIDVQREFRCEETYDLDIDRNHNYFAEGILVHNSLYSWNGASPELFLEFPCDEEITLKQSYRLPKRVKDYAISIVKRIGLPIPQFDARNETGEVKFDIFNPSYLNGSTFILCRTRFQISSFYDLLLDYGIPFHCERIKENPIFTSKGRAFLAIKKLKDGQAISLPEIRAICEHTTKPFIERGTKTKVREFLDGEYRKLHLMNLGFTQEFFSHDADEILCQRIEDSEKAYLSRVYKKHGRGGFEANHITLTTQHGAKGSEREIVIISPNLTKRIYDSYILNERDETLLAYTSVTRAMEKVIILLASSSYCFPYPTAQFNKGGKPY